MIHHRFRRILRQYVRRTFKPHLSLVLAESRQIRCCQPPPYKAFRKASMDIFALPRMSGFATPIQLDEMFLGLPHRSDKRQRNVSDIGRRVRPSKNLPVCKHGLQAGGVCMQVPQSPQQPLAVVTCIPTPSDVSISVFAFSWPYDLPRRTMGSLEQRHSVTVRPPDLQIARSLAAIKAAYCPHIP